MDWQLSAPHGLVERSSRGKAQIADGLVDCEPNAFESGAPERFRARRRVGVIQLSFNVVGDGIVLVQGLLNSGQIRSGREAASPALRSVRRGEGLVLGAARFAGVQRWTVQEVPACARTQQE